MLILIEYEITTAPKRLIAVIYRLMGQIPVMKVNIGMFSAVFLLSLSVLTYKPGGDPASTVTLSPWTQAPGEPKVTYLTMSLCISSSESSEMNLWVRP